MHLESGEWQPETQSVCVFQRQIEEPGRRKTQHLPLSSPRNHDPRGAILIDLLLDLCAEADSTHNTIPKLLIQNRLVRIPIILNDLVQPVNQRLDGRHGTGTATVREAHELGCEDLLLQPKELGQLLDISRGGRCLPIEDGCDGDFAAA